MVLISQSVAQRLEITPIYTNNGYIIQKLEEKLIVDNYVRFVHVINLEEYVKITNVIEANIKSLQLNTVDVNLELLQRELFQLRENINTIIPRRQKRGLINVWGNSLKFLAGVMDNEDAEEIYAQLNNLDQNSRQITNEINKQLRVNNDLITSVDKIKNHINEQQIKLSEFLTNITTESMNIKTLTNEMKYALTILIDISTLNKQVEKIKDNILLSRLEVLAHDILTNEEIQKYNISIEILPYIRSSVLINRQTILFTISIPIFTKEKYFLALIIPLPNQNQEELLLGENNRIITSEQNIFEYTSDVVNKKNLRLHNSNCIRNLVKENNYCNFTINNEKIVEELELGLIVVKNLEVQSIIQNCVNQEITVKGHNLIKYSDCKIQIEHSKFVNKLEKFYNEPILSIPVVNMTKKMFNFTLEKIHLDNIQNRHKINYLEYKSDKNNFLTIIINIALITIIIACIVLYFYCKTKGTKQHITTKIELISNETQKATPETVVSKGGGVITGF